MLWTFENQEEFSYRKIDSGIVDCCTTTLEKQFPTQCSIEKFTKENVGKANPQQYNKAVTYSAGFTTGEKKIDDLRQEGKYWLASLLCRRIWIFLDRGIFQAPIFAHISLDIFLSLTVK